MEAIRNLVIKENWAGLTNPHPTLLIRPHRRICLLYTKVPPSVYSTIEAQRTPLVVFFSIMCLPIAVSLDTSSFSSTETFQILQ